MPEAVIGGCGSYGIAFLFSVIPARPLRASASLPVTPSGCRSSSARWVSVPPEIARMPCDSSAEVRAWALVMTWRA
jgi:hypothetical protein